MSRMASSAKRRKLQPSGDEIPVMSAFAARARLTKLRSLPSSGSRGTSEIEAEAGNEASSALFTPKHKSSSSRKRAGPSSVSAAVEGQENSAQTTAQHVVVDAGAHEVTAPSLSPTATDIHAPLLTPKPSGRASLPPVSPSPTQDVLQLSSFRVDKSQKNFRRQSQGRIVLRLADGERLTILGSYAIRIREGGVVVAGATLLPSEHAHFVHAPQCCALPVIRSTAHAVLEIAPHPKSTNIRLLERLNPLFGRLWNTTTDDVKDTYQILYTLEDIPKRTLLRTINVPAEWNRKIFELSAVKAPRAPVVLVCGPKSSGKSTFGRLLANRLSTGISKPGTRTWERVGILDLDPGQPEYTPPGIVALTVITQPNLATPFCHPAPESGRELVKAHAIASVTPSLDPEHFLECAVDLFARYRDHSAAPYPLIINTPGWVQGSGLDILTGLIQRLQPSEVVYMSHDGPEESTEALKAACQHATYSELPSQSVDFTPRTALHFRTMQMMSYFHVDETSVLAPSLAWRTSPLTEHPPWRVKYRGEGQGFRGILFYDFQPPAECLMDSMNGMVLAVVRIDGEAAFRSLGFTREVSRRLDEPSLRTETDGDLQERSRKMLDLPVIANPRGGTLDPRFSSALCLALVRGVDTQKGELHLLTPYPGGLLGKSGRELVLVAGKFDAPSWAYTEDLYNNAFDASTAADDAVDHAGIALAVDDEGSPPPAGPADEPQVPPHGQARTPWVEILQGNQRRAVGSEVWRVRRDLGRG